MTVLLWVLVVAAFLLVATLALLSWALFRLTSHPIRVIDVTPEDTAPLSADQVMKDVGVTPVTSRRWPYS